MGADLTQRTARPDAVVVGGGVIGLTTAVCLAEAGLAVLVRTADPVERTTSAVAGAMCGPTITGPDDPATRWSRAGEAEFAALAEDPRSGVRIRRGRLVSDLGDAPPPWAAGLAGFAPCTERERAGYRSGFWAELPFADMPRYLAYLTDRLRAAGGQVQVRPVTALADAAAEAPVVVNCTGVAAAGLAGDDSVRPVKGQHVLVANPGLTEFFYEGGAAEHWCCFFPHGDRVVLGGVALPDDRDPTPDPALAERILARCAEVEPRLAGARVLRHEVGFRPVRPSVRLEEEPLGGARCVHNYGHGAVGVTLSWGCAREVAALVTG
ncbi:FAD-dependent oxidoreductase [Micromonospora fulviviridis]|uniref:FAD-dependent oxidoreductase n=1 Tax=Micromonospora fulviviridis TaxID=47860 RepID=UPI0037904FCF